VLPFDFQIRSIDKRGHRGRHVDKPDRLLCKSLDNADKGGTDDK